MRSLILHFFLLVLGVSFNLVPDTVYECSRFSKILSEKGFKFVSGNVVGLVSFLYYFILLPSKVDVVA